MVLISVKHFPMAFGIQRLRMPITHSGAILKSAHITQAIRRNSFQPSIIHNRDYSSGNTGGKAARSRVGFGLYAVIAATGVGGGYYLWTTQGGSLDAQNETKHCPKYQRVYNAIAQILEEDANYDDGSYGPIFVRLAGNASGTYCKWMNNGGSYKATMRFKPECEYHANKGLQIARCKLEKVKEQFPWISYGDLWTLGGICGVQEAGGPTIPWRPGRLDGTPADCPPDGRLPDGEKGTPHHPREIFYRMGFNDQEIVCLVGAHTLGRCHRERSGFEGVWTNAPTAFSNSFFVELLNRQWTERKWSGLKQFQDEESGELMMLPTDMSFLQDCKLKKWVKIYARDEKRFFADFAKAYQKLLELGVPYPKGRTEFIFKTMDAQQ